MGDMQNPVNELLRMVRLYSTPWEEKSAALKKLHEDYNSKKEQLNIAVKKLQLIDAHVRTVFGRLLLLIVVTILQGCFNRLRRVIHGSILRRNLIYFAVQTHREGATYHELGEAVLATHHQRWPRSALEVPHRILQATRFTGVSLRCT